jgi:endonuclease-3
MKRPRNALEHEHAHEHAQDPAQKIPTASTQECLKSILKNKKMSKADYLEEVIKRIKLIIPPGKFKHREPYHVLISTILSQRSKDENTAIAAKQLFKVYDTPQALATGDLERIQSLIKPAGLYKAKSENIQKVARILIEEYDSKVPSEINEMVKLPGVGRKTANCVLVYGFNEPAIPVDTHVHRISNRLGWVITRMPEETETALAEFLPKKYWIDINELLVRYGQEVCRPVAPRCKSCTLNDICPTGIIRLKECQDVE